MSITHLIRKADLSELEIVLGILGECARSMLEEGNDSWKTYIEAQELRSGWGFGNVFNNLRRGWVYLIHDQSQEEEPDYSKAVGTIALRDEPPDYYKASGVEDRWRCKEGKHLYSGTAGVLIARQGEGFYRGLCKFRDKLAAQGGYSSIRVDIRTRTKNSLRVSILHGFVEVHRDPKPDGTFNHYLEKSL